MKPKKERTLTQTIQEDILGIYSYDEDGNYVEPFPM